MFLPVRRRALAAAALSVCAGSALSGCLGYGSQLPAEKAFALSASALSGSDRYGFHGEVSIFDPSGTMVNKSRYSGEVIGHGKLNVQWAGGRTIRNGAAQGPAAFQPLQLLSALEHGNARVAYAAGPPAPDGSVRFRIAVASDAARSRIADNLRGELLQLKTGMNGRKLAPAQRHKTESVLSGADRNLQAALSTLKVSTECLWTADRRTWFPRQMVEHTELAYTWKGKPCREKRVSVTNFLPEGRSGTMVKNSSFHS